MFTDEQLRHTYNNRRMKLHPVKQPRQFTPIEIPCCVCGEAMAVAQIPGYGLKAFRNIGHAECIKRRADEQERAARMERTQAILDNPEFFLAQCGVPPHWRESTFDGCNDLPQGKVAALKSWADNPSGMVFLSGISGCGKTTLAVAVLRRILTSGVLPVASCMFSSEYAFLDQLKAGFSKDVRPPMPQAKVPFLIYDDMGVGTTDWAKSEAVSLLSFRHANDLPTIITSNLSPNDVSRQIDPRLMSRISENDMCIGLPAMDLRKPRKGH